jgi:hypothetical protein
VTICLWQVEQGGAGAEAYIFQLRSDDFAAATSGVGPSTRPLVMTCLPQDQGTFDLLHDVRNEAKVLYERAWGRPWPDQHSGVIFKTAIVSHGDAMPMDLCDDDDADYAYGSDPDALKISDELNYICLKGMTSLANSLGSGTAIVDALVVRHEYELLREAIEHGDLGTQRGIVVTGQPGICS